mgnify:CR=1 FL=1
MKKKVLITRKLLRSNEERSKKLWDVKLNLNDEILAENLVDSTGYRVTFTANVENVNSEVADESLILGFSITSLI